jgi:ABC-2 type transport system ATP-binding protein
MDEAESLSDELAIVDKGRVLSKGTPQEVKERNLSSRVRVDVSSGFAFEELQSYDRTVRVGNQLRVFTNSRVAEEISREALRRNVPISISPVTLDDVFVELVGGEIDGEEKGVEQGTAETREVMVK